MGLSTTSGSSIGSDPGYCTIHVQLGQKATLETTPLTHNPKSVKPKPTTPTPDPPKPATPKPKTSTPKPAAKATHKPKKFHSEGDCTGDAVKAEEEG